MKVNYTERILKNVINRKKNHNELSGHTYTVGYDEN